MMTPLWMLGIPNRLKTIKEGKLLKQQIEQADEAAAALANTAQTVKQAKPNLLLPGAVAIGAGALGGKVLADSMQNGKGTANYMARLKQENYANFIAFDILAGLENSLATTVHAVKNSRLKKKLSGITNANEVARAGIEAERAKQFKDVPLKLAGLATVGAGVAAPVALNSNNATNTYMNTKYAQPLQDLEQALPLDKLHQFT